ncbi:hypothetical protein DPMN_128708 [Dreissena polymorpha]|uniref:Shisa N-terminal domain-containing protein n=1 Tax=Dreissena polymorpha TaxID=45954 RepID=A0A9D4H4H2_DREPO|nr:hypothetical protein DPMN_128708 [Dreissena polymorpha]
MPSTLIEIWVCRKYEADSNGTYLGLFTCPRPIVLGYFHYCCGVAESEYCRRLCDV